MVTTKAAAKTPPGAGDGRSGAASTGSAASAASIAASPSAAPGRLLRVTHDTEYRYAARVESAQHQARL
ncbi:transglutaminase-like protein, partial [Burkholderia sp. TJI49]